MTETNGDDRALPDMPETPVGLSTLTCAQVEEGDFEARYLANRLDADRAAAYEAHYFGCERCWSALRRATEVRAALASAGPAARRSRWILWALPAAAMFAAVGVWRLIQDDQPLPGVVLRGAADSLALTLAASPDTMRAAWLRHAEADVYRVRGFTADGGLVWSIETRDTAIAAARRGVVRVDVTALDRARTVIAQSALQGVDQP
jgi:hypothetical protein